MTDELKPCPFCGYKASIMGGSAMIDLLVVCNGCGSSGREFNFDDLDAKWIDQLKRHPRKESDWESARKTLAEKAIAAWNTRTKKESV